MTVHPPLSKRPKRRRTRLAAWLIYAVLVALGGGLAGGVAWLGDSEPGLRWLCSQLAQRSGGRLQIDGVGGRLLGDWRAQTVRWSDSTGQFELRQLAVGWSPRQLLHGRLAVERIEAASLRVFSPASSAPTIVPDSLQLPLAVTVAQLRLGRVLYGELDGVELVLAEEVDATLASDGAKHRVERLQARRGPLTLSAQATLAGQRPFAVAASAALSGAARGQSFVIDLLGSGTLAELRVDAKAAAGEAVADSSGKPAAPVAGTFLARLAPFAAEPLASLRAQLSGVDPSLIAAGAPQALLDVDLAFERDAVDAAGHSGQLQINNRTSGRFDRALLPLRSLQTQITRRGDVLTFDQLLLRLVGGGRLSGQGRLADARLDLDLTARAIDAQALDARLLPTRLAGPLRARLGSDLAQLDVDWRDARYALRAIARVDAQSVDVERLELASGQARLAVQGKLALTGERRFTAQGRLGQFDPARFLQSPDLPRALLNARFDARGALHPAIELALHFVLRDSRIGSQTLSGQGDVDFTGSRLRRVAIDLDAAGNRLHTAGAFGRAGDTLRLTLDAPKLGALGWSALSGELSATLDVAGSPASPEFSVALRAARLHLASWLAADALSIDARLAAGAQGALAGTLNCSACALPAAGIAPLTLELRADGTRQQHRLIARGGLPDRRELRVALAGGLLAATGRKSGAPVWSGMLSELRLAARAPANASSVASSSVSSSAPLVELAAPAALQVGASSLSFGPATFGGSIGRLVIDRLAYDPGRWQSAGRLQQFRPQALLAELPALAAWRDALASANTPPLVLAGEWDVTLGAAPVGRAALWRERGDLRLGALALGLAEARLQATLGDGRLMMSAQLRGTRLGEINAELTAPGGQAGPTSTLIDWQAPWQGRLQAKVPDLAWLGPLLGEGWQLAGKLQGEMRLTGSAAHPQLNGEWRGDDLALRALDQGMRLERGEALLEITPQRLLLRRLSFASDFQPLPRVLRLDPRIDAARLSGTPGRLEASGELALGDAVASRTARLAVHLDRVGVMQRPEQWVALSGDGELKIGERRLDVTGKLAVDAGFWALAPAGRPMLSDDVVLSSARSAPGGSRVGRALNLDLVLALGRSVHFRGAGVDARLAGDLRIRSDDAGLPRATGSIRTVDGRFDAYGQKLDIERGIVNFQGPIDNPGLNLLAVRKNLSVEAGVEVSGTAQRPLIRLVSTPNVPDAEKLSWLVLGRSPEQQGGDSALLLAAAQTILGGQGGGVLSQLQRALGIDELGVSSGQIGSSANQPSSRVASSTGFGGSQSVNGQIVSVGKRLSANALLSYEQSLSTTESIVKLTVNLNRQFSVVGRAGSDSALDFFWNYSFGR